MPAKTEGETSWAYPSERSRPWSISWRSSWAIWKSTTGKTLKNSPISNAAGASSRRLSVARVKVPRRAVCAPVEEPSTHGWPSHRARTRASKISEASLEALKSGYRETGCLRVDAKNSPVHTEPGSLVISPLECFGGRYLCARQQADLKFVRRKIKCRGHGLFFILKKKFVTELRFFQEIQILTSLYQDIS